MVPVLYAGEFSRAVVDSVMDSLAANGSTLVPGWLKPEGVVVYLPGPRVMFKQTFEFAEGKWAA